MGAALFVCAAGAVQAEPACRATGEDSAAVVAVTARFEVTLDDGRLARLVGLAAPAPDFLGGALAVRLREAADRAWRGRPVIVQASGPPDRWGRAPALLAPVEGGDDLATWLLGQGAALVGDAREGGVGGPDCPVARLSAERRAREAGVGLWSEAYYGVQRAEDRDGLLARGGSFALVEGTVRRVGTGRLRLYLDFGAGRDGFSVSATTRVIRAFEAAGTNLRALAGRRVRVRGLIDIYAGRDGDVPRMDLVGPGALEPLEGGAR